MRTIDELIEAIKIEVYKTDNEKLDNYSLAIIRAQLMANQLVVNSNAEMAKIVEIEIRKAIKDTKKEVKEIARWVNWICISSLVLNIIAVGIIAVLVYNKY